MASPSTPLPSPEPAVAAAVAVDTKESKAPATVRLAQSVAFDGYSLTPEDLVSIGYGTRSSPIIHIMHKPQ